MTGWGLGRQERTLPSLAAQHYGMFRSPDCVELFRLPNSVLQQSRTTRIFTLVCGSLGIPGSLLARPSAAPMSLIASSPAHSAGPATVPISHIAASRPMLKCSASKAFIITADDAALLSS